MISKSKLILKHFLSVTRQINNYNLQPRCKHNFIINVKQAGPHYALCGPGCCGKNGAPAQGCIAENIGGYMLETRRRKRRVKVKVKVIV